VIARLDRLLGRVTMYLLLIAILTVIAVVALVLAFLDVLSVDPLALLASAAVLIAVTAGANYLLASIFRTRHHASSGMITALLLLLVLQPTIDLVGLLGLAIAAITAAASKYVIAWRGRHLANPAAVGALVVGITGLAFPSWWVGTPPLLPLVAVGSLLILWRTRHLGMGALYVLVSTAIIVGQFLAGGTPFATALSFALLSSPVVFTAGFMLSEPLTLPPRSWQRLALAVVVALLANVHYSFGIYGNTPELALVVGGVLAFFLGQRRAVELDLVSRRQLTPTAWEFRFKPVAPVRYEAGQYVELTLPQSKPGLAGDRRVFSLTSAPGDPEVTIGVRIRGEASNFKRALLTLEPGARVRATGVWGDFTLPRDPDAKLAFIAAGIGVTPFVSHLAALGPRAADAELLYSVRAASDLAYRDELAATGARVSILSPDDPGELPDGWSWLGSGELSADVVHRAVPDARERHVYLSGAPTDVSALRRALRAAGTRRIRTDVFLGY